MEKTKKNIRFDYKIQSYFKWPFAYLIIIGFLTAFGLFYDISVARDNDIPYEAKLSILYGVIFVISCILTGVFLVITKRYFMREVINFAQCYGEAQTSIMAGFKLPYIILDTRGKIRWSNNEFEATMNNHKCVGTHIDEIIPFFNREMFDSNHMQSDVELDIINKRFRIFTEKLSIREEKKKTLHKKKIEEQELYVMYFFDVTSEYELLNKYNEEKPVPLLVYVDNFDEVTNSIEDVRKPILIALIDRTIKKFAMEHNAINKKFEKDKYLILLQRKQLEAIKESKFELLDTMRNISIGNEMSVTLSIGVGVNDTDFSGSYQYAKAAIDLALGRGGDQAVLKKHEKLSFYGGKTRSVEKSTRVKARVKAHAFRELLKESDKIIIMGHRGQDMDSLGAAIGVYACARHFNKEAHIIIDQLTTSVQAMYDLFVESEEVPDDLFIKGVEASALVTEESLLVVVDVNRPSYTEYPDILEYATNIVVFDHHRTSADSIENALISYVETYASSTCEMITEIVRYISDKVKLTTLEADALFAGISVDTKHFAIKAGVKTFEAAAFLRRSGADVVRVKKLFKNDMKSYKARATAVRDAQIFRENMAITVCPSDITESTVVGAQAADELLNIQGIKASFVLTDINGTIYISSRSHEDINVQLIMERMGGGGHLSVAGAQLEDKTTEEAIEILKNTINEIYKEGDQ